MFLSATYEVSNVSTFSPTLVFPFLHVETSFLILPKLKNDSKFKLVMQERNLLAEAPGKSSNAVNLGLHGALLTTSLPLGPTRFPAGLFPDGDTGTG